jgi:uncharacterized protein (TIGR03437 family)
MRFAQLLLVVSAATGFQAAAQTTGWDTSGNGMLNGTYYFRQVIYVLGSSNGSLSDALSLYGTVSFTGTGTYTINATEVDLAAQQLQLVKQSGTYSIAASGQGFLSSPLASGDLIKGLVNQQGIFVGSSTETLNGYNDLFIAAPLASPLPTASTFKGPYSMAYMDLSSGSPLSAIGLTAQMNPDGNGNTGTVPISGYIGQNGSGKIVQTLPSAKYLFSGGAAVVTFPNSNNAFLSGQFYLYFSPDGNFVFGGSPVSADMFVGVRTGTSTPNLNGLYYEAGLDEDESQLASGFANPDSFYGSFSANAGVIVGHQRIDSLASPLTFNFTYSDSYTLGANGAYSTPATNFVVGPGIRIGSGIGPFLGLSVGLAAPSLSSSLSSSGVFLNPTGVVNAGSSAPFTAGIAPGELLTLYGANLAPALQIASGVPFPTILNGVQVKINDILAPLYYVTPGQLSAIVPYSVTTGIAQVQVINNGVASNTVTVEIALTAPGVLTQSQNGLGYGDAVHQDGSLVTPNSPAQVGETVSLFLTGLGAVNPTIADGAAGPTLQLSSAASTIQAFIGGAAATVTYSGLAPQLAGLYQINLTVPTGVTAGDNSLAIAGPDAYSTVSLIAIGSGPSTTPAAAVPAFRAVPRNLPGSGARDLRHGPGATIPKLQSQ